MFTRFLTGPLCFVPRLFRGQFANVRWVGGGGWMSGPLKSDNLTQCNELSDIFPVFPTLELYRKMYIYMVRPQKYIFTFPCEGSHSFSHCHASVVGSVGHIKLWNCWATLLTQLCRTMHIALLEILKSHFYYRSFVGESAWKRQLVSISSSSRRRRGASCHSQSPPQSSGFLVGSLWVGFQENQ